MKNIEFHNIHAITRNLKDNSYVIFEILSMSCYNIPDMRYL